MIKYYILFIFSLISSITSVLVLSTDSGLKEKVKLAKYIKNNVKYDYENRSIETILKSFSANSSVSKNRDGSYELTMESKKHFQIYKLINKIKKEKLSIKQLTISKKYPFYKIKVKVGVN